MNVRLNELNKRMDDLNGKVDTKCDALHRNMIVYMID